MAQTHPTSSIWIEPGIDDSVKIIDQRTLPHHVQIVTLRKVEEAATAIRDMLVRGAPLIGVTAAFGMWLALRENPNKSVLEILELSGKQLLATRPTAVNLQWAIGEMRYALTGIESKETAIKRGLEKAIEIRDHDIDTCRKIGEHGVGLIAEVFKRTKKTVNILTHCNAGWLACVKWGTATSPIYKAQEQGIPIHVWVDETRPRNQGASLTAWELGNQNIPHSVITDNAGGHFMQQGKVDLCFVGSDRTTRTGDVANKIGTYLKALAAHDNRVPFYVCLPSSTIDWNMKDGLNEIPIEERDEEEVSRISGLWNDRIVSVKLMPQDSPAANPGFDITPARLVSGLVTERGICRANEEGLKKLFPERN